MLSMNRSKLARLQPMADLGNEYLLTHRFLHRENEDVNEVYHNEDYSQLFQYDHE